MATVVRATLADQAYRELRSRVTRRDEAETEAVRRTAELWTFERPVDAKGSGWTLARVDAAEA